MGERIFHLGDRVRPFLVNIKDICGKDLDMAVSDLSASRLFTVLRV